MRFIKLLREFISSYRKNQYNMKYILFLDKLSLFYILVFQRMSTWERKRIKKRELRDIKNGTYKRY